MNVRIGCAHAAVRAQHTEPNHRSMSFRIVACAAASALLAACSSTSGSASVAPTLSAYDAAVRDGQAYTLVVMRRGPAMDTISPAELGEVTQAHMEFTASLAEEGLLLVSGPVVPPRADRDLRSFGIVDTADVQGAYARACSDPACEAGALECEAIPFITSDDLRAVPAMERGNQLQRGSDQVIARPYVMVEVPTNPATDAMIAQMGDAVLFSGHCTRGSFEGSTLIAVDCRTAAEAQAAMESMGPDADEFIYHPWVSTQSLTGLAQ